MIGVVALIGSSGAAVAALGYALLRTRWIHRQPDGGEALARIGSYVADGAMTFLVREYRVLVPFVLVVAAFLALAHRGLLSFQALAFAAGAGCSALAGFFGMRVATAANMRTTAAARSGLTAALRISFAGGSVMGLCVVGLALLGLFGVLVLTDLLAGSEAGASGKVGLPLLSGFSMGASTIALFTRVGGGIYTKAADIGADLVGKLEADIPEDDPRNPATIADNVGDNVGDVAGMGADLFESYAGTVVGCIILGHSAAAPPSLRVGLMELPLYLCALGVLCSMAGIRVVGLGSAGSPQRSLSRGTYLAAALAAAGSFPVILWVVGDRTLGGGAGYGRIYLSFLIGLAAGVLIGALTEYFTGMRRKPVSSIVRSSETGPATTLITGIGVGMFSAFLTMIVIASVLLATYAASGLYGLGISALGMLSTLGIGLAVDAYGPIADNAGGLAAMAELPPEVRGVTDRLDAVGNTTAAIGKGFAIGSAALTSVILFTAFKEQAGVPSIDLADVRVLAGIFIGAAIPYFFSSMAMSAIGRAAFAMIQEVRRQFREKPGILSAREPPDYNRCIGISTTAALHEMILPGLIAAAAPVAAGFLGGVRMLMGLLAGSTVSGVILSVFMSNAGGAWDNAKKSIEEGASGGKGSASHHAAIVGDTVGDPLKDAAGPSLNILIKMMAIISLVLAPLLRDFWS